jgi:xanthine dehydrogenase iron-sulfur cluster and FAD-binding subunit A
MVNKTAQNSSSLMVDYLLFFVNGKEVIEHDVEPDWTLLWFLRNSNLCSNEIIHCILYVLYF